MKAQTIYRVTSEHRLVSLDIKHKSSLPEGWHFTKDEAIEFKIRGLDAQMKKSNERIFEQISQVRGL